MEYVVGSLVTIIIVIMINRLMVREFSNYSKPVIRYSQSHIYTLMSPFLSQMNTALEDQKKRQSSNYAKKAYVRILVFEKKAYWIRDNALYVADFSSGMVDHDTAQRVDTMAMNKVELQKTMMIVEKLREGKDYDTGSAGES